MSGIFLRNNYKLCVLFILLFEGSTFLSAQSKFSVSAGWGYYELANIGAQWNISKISSLSLYGGTNFGLSDNTTWSAGLGDVDELLANAAATKARGISLEYGVEEINSDVVSLIHNKGYGLIVWLVNEPDDIKSVWDSQPDFIETDNAEFKDFIIK
jgi:hypothetical protein